MTKSQRRVLAAVTASTRTGQWYSAKDNAERVSLSNLYKKGLLVRRSRERHHEYSTASGGLAR